jgi:hydrogenase nickel incorporation protein HypA/HybF
MHEYGIVETLLATAERHARDRGASKITRLEVRIGGASGVDPTLVAKAYEVFRERTMCEGAPLSVTVVPPRWRCPSCERDVAGVRCDACRGPARLAEGEEILLDRIEMEVP